MKPLLVFSAATLLVFAPALATGFRPQEATPAPTAPVAKNPVKPTAASQEKAKKLFEQDCAMCHGSNGDGKTDLAKDMQLTLGDWTNPATLAAKSDQQLFNAIRKGNEKPLMPPEDEARAKNDEVWNLIIYIRSLWKTAPPAPAAPAVPPAPAAPSN
jgi:mono/diheme cytochrome c family protein